MSTTDESTERTENIGFEVTPEMKRKVRGAAGLEDKSMSEFLREVVEEAVDDRL